MEATRTQKSIKNAAVSVVAQVFSLVVNFATRTALVWGLGSYYLGLNSVMTSLIAVFALAELGLGNAIVFSLYLPLAKRNKSKVEAYLRLFKTLYRCVGCAIILLGCLALPFLGTLINGNVTAEVVIAYLLFVANTALSYFLLNYRTTLIQANQERYLVTLAELIYAAIGAVLQIFFFCVIHSFILGVASLLVAQIGKSIFIYVVCRKRYSKINFHSKDKLEKSEKQELARNVYALSLGRFSDTASNNVPALVISSMIGLIQSGLFSNYQMISLAITQLMSQVSGAVTASVGNLNVEASAADKERVFDLLSFIEFFGYTVCSVCLFVGIQPFISAWLGGEYCLPKDCAFAVAFNLLTIGVLQSTVIFKDACGIFYKGRFRPVVSCIMTIVLSVVFAYYFGIVGVMFAPAISRLLTASWYDPWLVHKYVFGKKPYKYYLKTLGYLLLGLLLLLLAEGICSIIPGESWLLFFEKVLVGLFVSFAAISIIFHRYTPFVWCFSTVKGIIKKNK